MDYPVSDRDLILQYLQCINQQEGSIRELNESLRNLTRSMASVLVEYMRNQADGPLPSPLSTTTDTGVSTLPSDTSADPPPSRHSRATSTTRTSTSYAEAARTRRAPVRRAWQERREPSYTPGRTSSSTYTFPTRRRWSASTRLRSASIREEDPITRVPIPPPPPPLPTESVMDDTLTQDILDQTMRDSPVRVRPSLRQIRRGTRLSIYQDVSGITQTICPIEREDFLAEDSILQILHCGHVFREMSLRRHFRNSPRCPLCRYDIRDYLPAPPPIPQPPPDEGGLPGIGDPFRGSGYMGMSIRQEIDDASGNIS